MGSKHSTDQFVMGKTSTFLAGTGEYLHTPVSGVDTDFDFGTGDFTIDFWWRPIDLSANDTPMAAAVTGGPNDGWFLIFQSGTLNFQVDNGVTFKMTSTHAPQNDRWQHIAVIRNGPNFHMAMGGTMETVSIGAAVSIDSAGPWTLGSTYKVLPANFADGYFDEIRVSKGIARWTTDFVPQTFFYTSDADTVLLIHSDTTDGDTSFIDTSCIFTPPLPIIDSSYGMTSSLGFSPQNSFKTFTASFDYIPFISETLTTNIDELISGNVQGRFDEPDSVPGIVWVGGEVDFEPHPTLLGHFLRGVTGQASSTAVGSAIEWEFLRVQNDFSSDCSLPPYTLALNLRVGSAYQFTDALIHGLDINVEAGELVKAKAFIIARVSSFMPRNPPSFDPGDAWDWSQASLSVDGVGSDVFESYNISFKNTIAGIPTLDNSNVFNRFKRTDHSKTEITGTMDFENEDEFLKFVQNSHQPMVLTLTDQTAIASGFNNVMKVDLPKFRYTTYPIESDVGKISISFAGKGLYDTTSNYSSRVTLTNTKLAYSHIA